MSDIITKLMTIDKIKKELEERFTEAGFKPITITMKNSGDVLKLEPHGIFPEIEDASEICEISIESPRIAGHVTMKELARIIDYYDELPYIGDSRNVYIPKIDI